MNEDVISKVCKNFYDLDAGVLKGRNILVSTARYTEAVFIEKTKAERLHERKSIFLGEYNGESIIYIGMPGSPSHAATNFFIIKHLNPKRVIYAGWAGSLDEQFRFGDLFYVTTAISLEGVMQNHGFHRGAKLSLESTIGAEVQNTIKLKPGNVITVSDRMWEFSEEQREIITSYSASAVEMETSVLYGFIPSNSIAIHAISDEPLKGISFNYRDRIRRLELEVADKHVESCLRIF